VIAQGEQEAATAGLIEVLDAAVYLVDDIGERVLEPAVVTALATDGGLIGQGEFFRDLPLCTPEDDRDLEAIEAAAASARERAAEIEALTAELAAAKTALGASHGRYRIDSAATALQAQHRELETAIAYGEQVLLDTHDRVLDNAVRQSLRDALDAAIATTVTIEAAPAPDVEVAEAETVAYEVTTTDVVDAEPVDDGDVADDGDATDDVEGVDVVEQVVDAALNGGGIAAFSDEEVLADSEIVDQAVATLTYLRDGQYAARTQVAAYTTAVGEAHEAWQAEQARIAAEQAAARRAAEEAARRTQQQNRPAAGGSGGGGTRSPAAGGGGGGGAAPAPPAGGGGGGGGAAPAPPAGGGGGGGGSAAPASPATPSCPAGTRWAWGGGYCTRGRIDPNTGRSVCWMRDEWGGMDPCCVPPGREHPLGMRCPYH